METSTWYVIKQRLAWIKMHQRGVPVTQVCAHFGISRKTFYKWLHRYQEAGKDFHSLRDHSRRPQSHPKAIPPATTALILSLRRKSRYGPRRLAYYLGQDYGLKVSVFGIYRVLQRAGLVKKRRSRPRKRPLSYAMLYPGQRLQVDVKYLPKLYLKNRPEPFQEYLYTAIDDCTRLQFAWVAPELTPMASVLFLQRLVRTFPFPIQEIQTDHGVEFTYVFFPHVLKPHPFEEALRVAGIRHKLIPVATPEANGKVERVHRTLDEECLNHKSFRKPGPRQRAIRRFLKFYNHHRPHSALGWLSPLQKLQSFPIYQRVTHV